MILGLEQVHGVEAVVVLVEEVGGHRRRVVCGPPCLHRLGRRLIGIGRSKAFGPTGHHRIDRSSLLQFGEELSGPCRVPAGITDHCRLLLAGEVDERVATGRGLLEEVECLGHIAGQPAVGCLPVVVVDGSQLLGDRQDALHGGHQRSGVGLQSPLRIGDARVADLRAGIQLDQAGDGQPAGRREEGGDLVRVITFEHHHLIEDRIPDLDVLEAQHRPEAAESMLALGRQSEPERGVLHAVASEGVVVGLVGVDGDGQSADVPGHGLLPEETDNAFGRSQHDAQFTGGGRPGLVGELAT